MIIHLMKGPLDGEDLQIPTPLEEILVPIHIFKDKRAYKVFSDACKVYYYRRASPTANVGPVAHAKYKKTRECQTDKKGEVTAIYYDYVEMTFVRSKETQQKW